MTIALSRYPLFFLWVVLFIGACNHNSAKPTSIDVLMQAESAVTAGAETLRTAIDLGQVDTNSREYAAVYDGLQAASTALDAAWVAYRAGNAPSAEQSARTASSAYMAIRPLLLQITGSTQ